MALLFMGYSKRFLHKSANELCQVGKVNDSLLSLKYLFPIEERQYKSTFVIQSENKNIDKIAKEVKNTPDLREIKKQKEFSSKREEILAMIWNMEEEIMGKDI